jgi:hypothetical protein
MRTHRSFALALIPAILPLMLTSLANAGVNSDESGSHKRSSFALSVAPSSLTVLQGNQGISTVTTTISNGFNSSIALSASGVPSGTTVSFDPSTIPAPGSGNSTLTIMVGSSTPVGAYPVTVTGSALGIDQTATVNLTVTGNMGSGQFMQLDPTGKFLVNGRGEPVFVVGEDAWSLATGLDNTDLNTYLSTRASQGYNFAWVALADNTYQANPPKNYYGYSPFDGADFTSFDSNYWSHIDLVVSTAATYGITLGLSPAFVGNPNGGHGYLSSYQSASDATLISYGEFLGNRYKSAQNIIWVLGGDFDPKTGVRGKLNDLLTGIRSAGDTHLATVEVCETCGVGGTPIGSIDGWKGNSTPIQLNWGYAAFPVVHSNAVAQYDHSNPLPLLQGEDWYELEHGLSALQLREQGYWEVLSGCTLGRTPGNNAIWTMAQGIAYNSGVSWRSQLTSGQSIAEEYMGKLFRSREFWKMAPDTRNKVLTGGIGSGTSISVASCTSDGRTCIVYDPIGNSQAPRINMAYFSGTIHAWWFNPSTAETTDLGTFKNKGTYTFTPPDGNDWVLVLDLNRANLPPPGGQDL